MTLRRHRNTSCLSDRWIPNLRYSAGNGIRKLTPLSFIRRLYVILKLPRYTNRRRAGSVAHRAKRLRNLFTFEFSVSSNCSFTSRYGTVSKPKWLVGLSLTILNLHLFGSRHFPYRLVLACGRSVWGRVALQTSGNLGKATQKKGWHIVVIQGKSFFTI